MACVPSLRPEKQLLIDLLTAQFVLQENKAREVAEVQRRHRDRLQNISKRRSTATCSSRDREMEGVALESVLHKFLNNRGSRRKLGRPSSSNGSPTSDSPNNGSLSEITSEVNLPTGKQKKAGISRIEEIGRKDWNSAGELTENSPQKNVQSNSEDNKKTTVTPREEETNTFKKEERKEDPISLTHPANRTTSISSSGRSFSAATDDDEEDLQDNNEEEARKLREASRKVLRFQNSRSSVSSGDYSLENQKSPGASKILARQRTFDEETERYPGDPTNDELVTFLLTPPSSSKRNLGRRHTLPAKVSNTEDEEDSVWAQPPLRTPKSAARVKEPLQAEGGEHSPSKQVFDFSEISQNLRKSGAQDQDSPSAEKKSKPNVSITNVPDSGPGQHNQEGKSMEPTGNHVQRNSENVPPKAAWIKTETTGLFFSFLKRLGDMSKAQNSKETVQKASGSGV